MRQSKINGAWSPDVRMVGGLISDFGSVNQDTNEDDIQCNQLMVIISG